MNFCLVLVTIVSLSQGLPMDKENSLGNDSFDPLNCDLVVKLNKGMDAVLESARSAFKDHSSLALPNIKMTFGKAPYSGVVTANRGYFMNTSSLSRMGDVIIDQTLAATNVQVPLTFTEIETGFKNYSLDVLGNHESGDIKVSIEHNNLTMSVDISLKPCTLRLAYIKFNEITGIHINITGLGVFQSMQEELSNWLMKNYRNNFRNIIINKLQERFKDILSESDICRYLTK